MLAETRKSSEGAPLQRRKTENYFASDFDLSAARIQYFHALLPLSTKKNP